METGMSDTWMQISRHAPVEVYSVHKENVIQRWNLQNCKKTEKPVKHDPDQHLSQNGSQDKQLHDQSAT